LNRTERQLKLIRLVIHQISERLNLSMKRFRNLTLLLLFLPFAGFGQTLVTGMVADSASFAPLTAVSIQVKGKTYGAISDARGFFKIQVSESDTLLFSMVGYNSKMLTVTRLRTSPVVYLAEETRILKTIEINADVLIPGLDQMKIDNWQNPSMSFSKTPGFQGIETFGPGYVMRGSELVHDHEARKLKALKKTNEKVGDYVEWVNSPEIKDKLMKDFNISQDEYYRLLATFNQKNQDIIYELGKEEVTSLLFRFFSENVNKK
jgi:hypothetical protein